MAKVVYRTPDATDRPWPVVARRDQQLWIDSGPSKCGAPCRRKDALLRISAVTCPCDA